MKKLTSLEIRRMWLDYFTSHGHLMIESAPLIPYNDDTLLWINAGVTPLKKYFDGTEVPDCRRLTNLQKCIRTNDIENVGVTRRHHTFFEMMGNFSVGDYFKDEAIHMSFELLTSEEWFAIPKEKLYVTIFPDDKKAREDWLKEGMLEDHIIPLEDNFWEIGPGPCGPDSEIFFDRGEKYDTDGKALEHFKKGEDNERYVEIWNNVFSQFNSEEGKSRSEYKELPSKNIDTGAGLERWACIFQDVDSNFDTDLFMPIINKVEELSGVMYDGSMPFKVIADHIRAITFALSDGAIFENVGRGYILRRLLRRSVRMGRKLGITEPFMYKLVETVIDTMKEPYPYLLEKRTLVNTLVLQEEELFNKTLLSGEKKLYELMDESIDNTISGYDAFKLYDTYGFPFELTLEYLEEKGFSVDKTEFDKYMEEQKNLSRANIKQDSVMSTQNELLLSYKKTSEFVYEEYKLNAHIIDLIDNDKLVESINKEGYLVLDKTPFYATSGGQVNDTGLIIGKDFKARVLDVFKAPNGQHIHKVKVLNGTIKVDDKVNCLVDENRRIDIEKNHSCVHLLQYSLRSIISNDIHQAGSRVDDNTLRFDFNYLGKLYDEDLIKVEEKVNELINEKIDRVTEIKKLSEIDKSDVMALFSEKYHEDVRQVNIGPSKELCGGTHIKNTGDIKRFAILNVENKGSNTYRIEACSDKHIEKLVNEYQKVYNDEILKLLGKAKNILSDAKSNNIKLDFDIILDDDNCSSYKDIIAIKNKVSYLKDEIKELEKKYTKLKSEKISSNLDEYKENIKEINKTNLLLKETYNLDTPSIKNILDNLANEYTNFVGLIVNINENNVNMFIRSNSNYDAGSLIKEIAPLLNGNGGGSKTFASGGGKDSNNINKVFEVLESKINE